MGNQQGVHKEATPRHETQADVAVRNLTSDYEVVVKRLFGQTEKIGINLTAAIVQQIKELGVQVFCDLCVSSSTDPIQLCLRLLGHDRLLQVITEFVTICYAADCALKNRAVCMHSVATFALSVEKDCEGNKDKFESWLQRRSLFVAASQLHSVIRTALLTATPFSVNVAPEHTPLLECPLLWLASTVLPSIYTLHCPAADWRLLYDSHSHGLSFNRLEHHVFSYDSSTVTLVQTEAGLVIVASERRWHHAGKPWGGPDTELLQIYPNWVQKGSGDVIYCNTTLKSAWMGLKFGKDYLELDDMLTAAKWFGVPTPLHRIQSWGCGASTAVEDADAKLKRVEVAATRAKNRNLKESWDDNVDRKLLGWGGNSTNYGDKQMGN